MGWHFNDLDVYVSAESDVLGETSYENWFRVSSCGLVRSRPTITRSTNSTQKIQRPGTIGEMYSSIQQRSNAKIQMEFLVGDIWPHEALKRSENTFLQTVLNRALYLEQTLIMAKRVAIKEQGHPTQEYYEVMDVATELVDADEKAATLKCTMEVYPFIYEFQTNDYISIAPLNTVKLYNELPYSECCPIYYFESYCGQNKELRFNFYRGTYLFDDYVFEIKDLPAGSKLGIDTKRMQAYDYSASIFTEPLNRYVKGDYDKLRFPQNSAIEIENRTDSNLLVYMRRGLRI